LKSFASQFLIHQRTHLARRNVQLLIKFFIALAGMIVLYSALFHWIMEYEGRYYSWFTGIYWTLTTMSTLGFGDVTFHSDLGRVFSMLVLVSGVVFLLVLLPFAFIEFVLEPIMRSQTAARAPRELSSSVSGHVILTCNDEITNTLIYKLRQYRIPYVTIVPELTEALRLHDLGVNVVLGDQDDPETYRRVGIERASLVATTASDATNASVVLTVREVSEEVPVVATANDPASVDLLELAGCHHVLQPAEMLGQMLARRTTGSDAMSHVIGNLDDLHLAEATVANTPIAGKTLRESGVHDSTGVEVVGLWSHGKFEFATPETIIQPNAVMVMAGRQEDFERYDELFCIYNVSSEPVVILGGGRVGRAVGRALVQREVEYRIVDKDPARFIDDGKHVLGNAAEFNVLLEAGLRRAPSVVITTRDDATNIYLTVYCRKLRPDVQILCRATEERNVSTLHRAGADFVMSYASMGGNALFKWLRRSDILIVAEGLSFFKVPVGRALDGRSIGEATTHEGEGWRLVAVREDGKTEINPPPDRKLTTACEIIVIGSEEAEERFLQRFV
jgi:Trk K+ transport system NAD-binding subunit